MTAEDLVVISAPREWTCGDCSGTGDLLIMANDRPLGLSRGLSESVV